MPSLILAAALATLPAGRGLPLNPASLDVAAPPGAVASLRYRDHTGAEQAASCAAPCRLRIPQGSPFLLSVELDGQRAALPPIRWTPGTWRAWTLQPAAVAATFEAR